MMGKSGVVMVVVVLRNGVVWCQVRMVGGSLVILMVVVTADVIDRSRVVHQTLEAAEVGESVVVVVRHVVVVVVMVGRGRRSRSRTRGTSYPEPGVHQTGPGRGRSSQHIHGSI